MGAERRTGAIAGNVGAYLVSEFLKPVKLNSHFAYRFLLLAITASGDGSAAGCSVEPPLFQLARHQPLEPARDIWPRLFKALPATTIVLPTENYYYFRLSANGRLFRGSLNFYAERLAQGVIGLNLRELGVAGGLDEYREFSAANGLFLRKIGAFRYELTYGSDTKIFQLNTSSLERPSVTLPAGHQALAKTFDESGLGFVLAFDTLRHHLYWILDEETSPDLNFIRLPDGLFVDPQTGFVFFESASLRLKFLIGVQRKEVRGNTWCDGPFDQLPDAAIMEGLLNLSTYIVAEFPEYRDKIDNYGVLVADRSERVALDAYRMYGDLEAFVDLARRIIAAYPDEAGRIFQLTRPNPWLRP